MAKSACAQCTVSFVPHAGLRCCFAECLAMCAWRACMHTVLRCSADACLLVPIFADHVGGAARCHAVRVVRAGLPLRSRRPSGHSREQEVVTGRDCKRGGGGTGGAVPKRWRVSSVCCMLCAILMSASKDNVSQSLVKIALTLVPRIRHTHQRHSLQATSSAGMGV